MLNSDAGLYDVVVSNSSGSVTSSAAALTVGSEGMLINGSFEFNYGGWIATGNQAVVSGPPFQASEGSKLVAFNAGQKTPNGVLSQIFPTMIGQTYILDFDAGAISTSNQNQQRMQVRVQGNALWYPKISPSSRRETARAICPKASPLWPTALRPPSPSRISRPIP